MNSSISAVPSQYEVPILALCATLEISPYEGDLAIRFGKPMHWSNFQLIDYWLVQNFKTEIPVDRLASVIPAAAELFKHEVIARLH